MHIHVCGGEMVHSGFGVVCFQQFSGNLLSICLMLFQRTSDALPCVCWSCILIVVFADSEVKYKFD